MASEEDLIPTSPSLLLNTSGGTFLRIERNATPCSYTTDITGSD